MQRLGAKLFANTFLEALQEDPDIDVSARLRGYRKPAEAQMAVTQSPKDPSQVWCRWGLEVLFCGEVGWAGGVL